MDEGRNGDEKTFDKDEEGMRASYAKMFDAYHRIFARLGLNYRAVAADNGAIGGSGSQEFHVIADTGEDAIVYCKDSEYAANLEAAQAFSAIKQSQTPQESIEKVAKFHKEYVKTVKGFGEEFYAEDLVQEMYIRFLNEELFFH